MNFETMAPNVAKEAQYKKEFPAGFIIGAASASYQVEGAWNENRKLAQANKESYKKKNFTQLLLIYIM